MSIKINVNGIINLKKCKLLAFLVFLPHSTDNKIALFGVFCHRGASTNITAFGNIYRSDNIAVASDKSLVANHRPVFFFTIVIYKNCPTSNVDIFSNVCVSYVSKVRSFSF